LGDDPVKAAADQAGGDIAAWIDKGPLVLRRA
jgi:hypothetical protein